MVIKTEFAIAEVTPGKLNALVKNIMLQTGAKDPNEAVRLVNSGEWVVKKYAHSWRIENGVVYFLVTSNGTTGKDWIKRSEDSGIRLGKFAKEALLSSDFKPTNGVTTEVAVLKGMIFGDNDRTTKKIRAYAEAFRMPGKRRLCKPNAELACLIREKFADKEIEAMDLWSIVAMHEPINSAGYPRLLSVSRRGDGRSLDVCFEEPCSWWNRFEGFAFEVSRVNSQR